MFHQNEEVSPESEKQGIQEAGDPTEWRGAPEAQRKEIQKGQLRTRQKGQPLQIATGWKPQRVKIKTEGKMWTVGESPHGFCPGFEQHRQSPVTLIWAATVL